MNTYGLILCRSDAGDGGWSLHAPGSTDEEIARGEALPLLVGGAVLDEDTREWSAPDQVDYNIGWALHQRREAQS